MDNEMGVILNLSFTDKNDAIIITDISPSSRLIKNPSLSILGNKIHINENGVELAFGTFPEQEILLLKCCDRIVMTTDMSLPNVQSYFLTLTTYLNRYDKE